MGECEIVDVVRVGVVRRDPYNITQITKEESPEVGGGRF